MRVVYVAKHGSGGNDDEGAVAYALETLGHTVTRLPESVTELPHGDLLLFHKWDNAHAVSAFRGHKAFWYFDLVEFPDVAVAARCAARAAWMERMMPTVDTGFCTDGDWSARFPKKLVQLSQGADSRIIGRGRASTSCDILFTGVRNGGEKRASFVDEMKRTYKSRFAHVSHGVHGRELANYIAGAKIVVAPDGPVTDSYWSNRVYLALGFGAFLLHPYCGKLTEHYADRLHLVYYYDRKDLHYKISKYLDDSGERSRVSDTGLAHTMEQHTYLHRCSALMEEVQKRG